MNKSTHNDNFISKWINNPEISQQPWFLGYVSIREPERYKIEAAERIRADPLLRTKYANNFRAITILAAGLWGREKKEAGKKIPEKENLREWAIRSENRLRLREKGEISEFPISQKDAAVYRRLISERLEKTI